MKTNNSKPIQNNKLNSVGELWSKELNSSRENEINNIYRVCSEEYKNMIDEYFDTENNSDFNPAYVPLEYSLVLNLYGKDQTWIDYYTNKAKHIASKVYNAVEYIDCTYKDDKSTLALQASLTLVGFVNLACAEAFEKPSIPDNTIMLDGICYFDKRLSALKSKIPAEEKDKCILASVMSLLCGRNDLSSKFLKRCESFKDVKKHHKVLYDLTEDLLGPNDKEIIHNDKLEKIFFNLFNAYRLPNHVQRKIALDEYPMLNTLISNYLFAWLYLKLFEGKTETTWQEMRLIMMA